MRMGIERYRYYRPQRVAAARRRRLAAVRRSVVLCASVVCVAVLGWGGWRMFSRHDDAPVEQHVSTAAGAPDEENAAPSVASPSETVRAITIAEGDIPAALFAREGGMDANATAALVAASHDVFDITKLNIGRPMRFFRDAATDALVRIEYEPDAESVIIITRADDVFTVRKEAIAYDVARQRVTGTIDDFFYVDALDAGLTEPTILTIGDIFSFNFDFMTDVRVGDTFCVVFDRRTRDGSRGPDGTVHAARFVNDGAAHEAYYFEMDGVGAYYDGEGHKLERQFLQAPLNYRRITSGFTGARLHPITKRVMAHYQIDYAAPVGTPVVATAHGTVTSAGWEGGWGNIVRMTHDNGYTTHYAHLSAFADGVRRGAHMSRGEIIGFVGSTGWSTGPHLDYGMRKGGVPVNPLKLEQPKGAPLDGDRKEAFLRQKENFSAMLDGCE